MKRLLLTSALVAAPIALGGNVEAQTTDPTLDPLHMCYDAPSTCGAFNGVTLGSNPSAGLSGWGISSSPAPQTGLLSIAVLIPQNDTETLFPSLTGSFSGTAVTPAVAISEGLFGPSADIGTIFGGTAPPNPISAYQKATEAADPGFTAADGYNVFLINITGNNAAIAGLQAAGSVTTGSASGQTNNLDNTFSFGGGDFQVNGTGPLLAGLPNGTILTAFLNEAACTDKSCGKGGVVSTAQSSALVIDALAAPPPPIPEPASLAVLGTGLIGLGFLKGKKKPSR